MPSDIESPEKSEKNNQKKEKVTGNSFLQNLKDFLTGENPGKQKTEDNHSSEPSTGICTEKTSNSPIEQEKTKNEDKNRKKDTETPQNPEEDPALYFINNFKEHEKLQSIKKKKDKILKIVAISISIVLIIVAIVYSLSPTEQVASNVIFGERAMFSVFLILIALLILSAVFAGKLLEGKFLKDINRDLKIVEGKKQKDEQKKSNHDPMKSMNKKNKRI